MHKFIKSLSEFFHPDPAVRRKRQEGAVSIFLCIVLIPMLSFALLFVDLSRFKLARGVIINAEDLALNSVLANFDGPLMDHYGLSAYTTNGSQMTVIPKTKEQFIKNMSGDPKLKGKAGSLLSVHVDKVEIDPVPGSALDNPAILRAEIVDFMKWRAPINGAVDLFKKFSSIRKSAKEAKGNGEIENAKADTYESLQNMLQSIKDINAALNEYENLKLSTSTVQTMLDNLKPDGAYEKDYKELHLKKATNWQGTEHARNIPPELIDYFNYQDKPTTLRGDKYSVQQVQGYMQTMLNYFMAMHSAKQTIESKIKHIPPELIHDIYDIDEPRWAYDMSKIIIPARAGMVLAMSQFIKAYNDWVYAYEHLDLSDDAKIKEANDYKFNLLGGSFDFTKWTGLRVNYPAHERNVYDHARDIVSYIWNDQFTKYWDAGKCKLYKAYTTMVRIWQGTPNPYIPDPANDLGRISGDLSGFSGKLREAKIALEKVRLKEGQLKKDIQEYKVNREKWKQTVNNNRNTASPEIVSQSDQELGQTEGNAELDKLVEMDDVTVANFFKRISNTKDLYSDIQTAIAETTYGGQKIETITKYSTFDGKHHFAPPDGVNVENYRLLHWKELAKESFPTLYKTSAKLSTIKITNDNNPDLSVPPNELYTFIMKFKPTSEEEHEEAKGLWESMKKWRENLELFTVDNFMPNEDPTNDFVAIANRMGSSGAQTQQDMNDMNAASAQINHIADFVDENKMISLRNDLYVTDYIMSMFMHDTTRQEEYVKIAGSPDMSLIDARRLHDSQENGKFKTNDDAVYTPNKNLRNQKFTSDNHWSVGNEIEYIQHGGINMENKYVSYGKVFGVRFVMNLLPITMYCFGSNPLQAPIKVTAHALCGPFQFLYPVMLNVVRAFFAVFLNIVESFIDVQVLKAGLPVKFLKKPSRTSSEDLQIDIENMFSLTASGAYKPGIEADQANDSNLADKRKKKGFGTAALDDLNTWYYSNYVYLFTFITVVQESDAALRRTADVMQQNLCHTDGAYNFREMPTYFQVSGEAKLPHHFFNFDKSVDLKMNYQFTQAKGY